MINISDEDMRIFLEQITVSSRIVQELKDDMSDEGTKKFYYHASLIENIKKRLQIAQESQSNFLSVKQELESLWK
ncbi:hypothetical protein [Virgibacillus sp. SK37]|uniref:hypothetical protein n=1 Tax=Virgibacillus sp. SK37 TaxID=403957 RepID=UPI0011A1EABD|nr:hypothetical protein [Virgibacillus sp. SK37]